MKKPSLEDVKNFLFDPDCQHEMQAEFPGKHLVCFSRAFMPYYQHRVIPPEAEFPLFVVRCQEDVAGVLICDEDHPFFQYLVRNKITIGRTLLPSELGDAD